MNLRLSATTLEAFRLTTTEAFFAEEAELVSSIRGEPFEERWQQKAGKAWHSVLENPQRHRVDGLPDAFYRSGRYTFDWKETEAAIGHIGRGVWELKRVKTYRVAGETIDLVCKADWIRGLIIQDNKCRFGKAGDPADYEGSLQWRAYLLVHEAEVFRYNLWSFREPKGGETLADGHLRLRDEPMSFRFWRYDDMEADVVSWLNAFVCWARSKNLLRHLLREGTP